MNTFYILAVTSVALLLLTPLALGAAQSLRTVGPPSVFALNVNGTHECGLTRAAEVAISDPNLLLKKGTGVNEVALNGATDRPVGLGADSAAVGEFIGVYKLGGDSTRTLVASGAIQVNDRIYTAADGKASATAVAGSWFLGYAESAAADGDEFEADTHKPERASPAVVVSTADTAISALQVESPGVVVSNAGAAGAVAFSLPAAVPGMRVDGVVEAAQELRLDPDGTETVALPSSGVQGAAGKYLTANAIGENVSLVCVEAGTWDVLNFTGNWTAEA